VLDIGQDAILPMLAQLPMPERQLTQAGDRLVEQRPGPARQRIGIEPPPVLQRQLPEMIVVADDFRFELAVAEQGVILQCGVAKSVNRRNHGFIHAAQRVLNQALVSLLLLGCAGKMPLQQQSKELVVGTNPGIERFQRLVQARLNALMQFVGGGVGKTDHQDFRWLAPVENMAQVQVCDGVGFTGAGTGLDQADAFEIEVETGAGVEHGYLVHRTSPCSSSCAYSRCA
jgi:hypothetical protein